ncbi:unnamed protein product, partial [Rangifer tarandus platyrhynchus]
MVSSPHREHPPKKGYDFDTVNKQTCQTYSFGKTSSCHLSIDASLTKLFECMTLAYSENAYCLLKYIFVPSKEWNCNRDFLLQRKNTSNDWINIL